MPEIVAIRTKDKKPLGEHEITSVKLASGLIENIPKVIHFIDKGYNYFFIDDHNTHVDVSGVHKISNLCYIKTIPNAKTNECLLDLPQF